MLNFDNVDTEIPLSNSVVRVWEVCMECPKWKEKKNWQTNCGNGIAENGEKKKKSGPKSGESKKKKSVTFTIFSQKITCDYLLLFQIWI